MYIDTPTHQDELRWNGNGPLHSLPLPRPLATRVVGQRNVELLDILVGQSEEDESNDGQHRDDEGGPVGLGQLGERFYPYLERGRRGDERMRRGGREGGHFSD